MNKTSLAQKIGLFLVIALLIIISFAAASNIIIIATGTHYKGYVTITTDAQYWK